MPQTHYIEVDEEIISAVGRLRRTSENENVFVFPKRSLILQSIVNLKLLEREARKLGKKIIVMTQDQDGRLLAEKAGLSVQVYQESMMRNAPPQASARFVVAPGESIPMPARTVGETTDMPHSARIGSSDFHETAAPARPMSPTPGIATSAGRSAGKSLRVRNASSAQITSLNSMRLDSGGASRPKHLPSALSAPPLTPPVTTPSTPVIASTPTAAPRSEKLQRFLTGTRSDRGGVKVPEHLLNSSPPPTSKETASASAPKSAWWAFAVLGIFSVIALAGTIFFVFLPKAEIFITPQGTEQVVKYQFVGAREGAAGSGTDALPARIVDEEKTVKITVPTTGSAQAGGEKARGSVLIKNNFNSAPQPLVATTRLATADGKIFRLIEGVTVPGMTERGGKKEPGLVEATVIADAVGEAYNIGPTDFTIPGFQGGPKFGAFSAQSTKAMTGGKNGDENGAKSVAASDLEQARRRAEEEVRHQFIDGTRSTLANGETLLEGSLTTSLVGTPVAPGAGTLGETFDYEARFRTRAFVLSEKNIVEEIERRVGLSQSANAVALQPFRTTLEYGTPLTNFDEGKVEFSVQANLVLRATIDANLLREELAGQDEAGIRAVLDRHTEIKRLRVEFHPNFFITTIPKDVERVMITLSEESE